MKKHILFLLISIGLLGGCSSPAKAGEYEFIEGKGVDVCENYFEYLRTEKSPLTCKRDFSPDITKLKRPNWKQLDINKNKLLILRIENYLQIPRDEKATQPWLPVKKEEDIGKYNVNTPGRLLYTTDIDIDNDGEEETLAKYRSFLCHIYDNANKEPRWKAPVVVLNDDGTNVSIEKTYPLMQNQFKVYVANIDEINERNHKFFQLRKLNVPYVERIKKVPVIKSKMKPTVYAAGISMHQGYDVFAFNDASYFDKWDEERRGKSYQSLTIYKNTKSQTKSICRYQYNDK